MYNYSNNNMDDAVVVDHSVEELSEELLKFAPPHVVRSETALSRYPVHTLAKSESVAIDITRQSENGKMTLQWKVSPNPEYGTPRQFAYKLDTLVINKRIDEAGRPIPRLICLGTYASICADLGIEANSGRNIEMIRKALHQNASAYIKAKINYRSIEGIERNFEAGFTRYSVVLIGDELPDSKGEKASAVYIYLNDQYLKLLNSAQFRPLDYAYQRDLQAGSQRLYELLSYSMYSALLNNRQTARLQYSDFCLRSPQTRYFDRSSMLKQMYKLHQPHLKQEYIKSVSYEARLDADGKPDWDIVYVPGRRARAQFSHFKAKQRVLAIGDLPQITTEDENPILRELERRGISKKRAEALLKALPKDQQVIDQLEWADSIVRSTVDKIRNPPGFYIHVLEQNISPPENFESSRLKKLREAMAKERNERVLRQQELEIKYEEYLQDLVEKQIRDRIPQHEYEALYTSKLKQYRKEMKMLQPQTLEEIAHRAVRLELKKRLPLPSIEEFEQILKERETRQALSDRQHNLFGSENGA